MTTIAQSLVISGTIEAEEPLIVAGTVRGSVIAAGHDVTLAPAGHVTGTVLGRTVIVHGRSSGRLIAREIVCIQAGARVRADIAAPQLSLEDGALFSGRVDPSRVEAALRVAEYRKAR